MEALALVSQPEAAPTRRRHVGCDVTVRWPGSRESLEIELRAGLIGSHVRLARISHVDHHTFVCRLIQVDSETHLAEAAVLDALACIDGWVSVEVLQEIDGKPAFSEVPA